MDLHNRYSHLFYLPYYIKLKICFICRNGYKALRICRFALSTADASSEAR